MSCYLSYELGEMSCYLSYELETSLHRETAPQFFLANSPFKHLKILYINHHCTYPYAVS
jgi:hypothetical protein